MTATRTIDIDVADSPFAAEHARIVGALRADAPIAAPRLCEQYAPEVREAARATWLRRMVNEHRSSAVFASLVPQLIEASSGIDVQTVVLRAATEEIYHATLCGAVVRAFGGDPRSDAEPLLLRMAEHRDVAPLERAMRNVLFVGCLAETVAVGLITSERELATEPLVRDVFTRILADEISHARLGWLYAARALDELGSDARQRTGAYLRVAFGYLERNELELLPLTPPSAHEIIAQREAAGLCEGSHARDVFYDTLANVIVPRLEALGVPAREAWRTRARPTLARAAA